MCRDWPAAARRCACCVTGHVALSSYDVLQIEQHSQSRKFDEEIREEQEERYNQHRGRTKIIFKDRLFLQSIFSKGGRFENCVASKKFPSKEKFRKIFYRILDSRNVQNDEDLERFSAIEEAIFRKIRKEKKDEKWENSLEQNKKMDLLIVSSIHSSFQVYEKNRKEDEPSFFNFKK